MTALLFDTNVLSGVRRPDRQPGSFRTFIQSLNIFDCYVSVVTIMEIETGIERQRPKDKIFADELSHWPDDIVMKSFEGRILPFDTATASLTRRLPTPERRPTPDAMISATAMIHGLTMATRNLRDFRLFGVPCVDPWA